MKYFVLGALASGLLLYGMSMIYGATGNLELGRISATLFSGHANRTILVFGLVFIVSGIAFKLGAVPYHMWVPDVYQGAPTAITLFIGTAMCSAMPAFHWNLVACFFMGISAGGLLPIAPIKVRTPTELPEPHANRRNC